MRFAKLHGLGNSYVYFDLVGRRPGLVDRQLSPADRRPEPGGQHPDPAGPAASGTPGSVEAAAHPEIASCPLPDLAGIDWPELARRVSHPGFGIGSDGLILILPSDRADLAMRIFNADGSEGEMCGNGIRGLACYAADAGLVRGNRLRVETLAGVLDLELVRESSGEGPITAVRVDMGPPRARQTLQLALDGQALRATAISMGNPHCVLMVDDVERAPVRTLGPRLETHTAFPGGTNVEFVQVLDSANVRMRVWERGSGETYACGTGACASVVAAALLGLTGRHVTVHMPGGQLDIDWAPNGHVYMEGPCEPICRGELSDQWLRSLPAARATTL